MRRGSKLAAAAGWTLLGALAVLGVTLSALAAYCASSSGQATTAGLLTRELDGLIAGRLSFETVEILSRGVEVRGVRLHGPDGDLVLSVTRARILADLTRLARNEVAVAVDLDSPSLLLEEKADGLSLARAVAPARRPEVAARPSGPGPAQGGRRWKVDLTRLAARGGEIRWKRQDGGTAVEASGLDLDAEGSLGDASASLRLHVRASVVAPLAEPFELEAAARLQGDRLEVPVLDVALGATRLQALGEGNLRTRAFRAALTRLGVAAEEARRLAPAVALGGDVTGSGYAESDGAIATAALEVPPTGDPAPAGTAVAAVALRIAEEGAGLGFDVALAELDPSRLLAQAPPGRLTLSARGAAAGRGLSDARGRIALALAPSRLRGEEVGPIVLAARARGGLVEVEKLEAQLPGLAVSGRGRWRERGPVAGNATVEAADLARLGPSLAALTGASLPSLGGRLRARATLTGTGDAPTVTATIDAPALSVGPARAEALTVSLDAAGPVAAARVRLTGRAARAEVSGIDAERLQLEAALRRGEARLSLTSSVPSFGPDPVVLEAVAHLIRERSAAEVRDLSIRWPGVRFALVRPALVTFTPPAVDRLELADGSRSIAVAGGLGPRHALDARLEVVRFDLARLPRGLLPPEAGIVGELSLDAHATGPARTPTVAGHVELTDAGVRGLTGLQVAGDVRWNGKRRLTAEVGLRRNGGGALDLAADLPLPIAAASSGEKVALTADASDWPVEPLRRAAGVAAPTTGTLGGRMALSGTAAAPRLEVALAIEDATVEGVGPLAANVALDDSSGVLRTTAATRLAGAPLVDLDARVPLDLVGLLRHPEAAVRALARAPLTGSVEMAGLDLARIAGKIGLPENLAGTVTGEATLAGTPSAPRGRAMLSVADGAVAGYRDLAAHLEVAAEAGRTSFAARGSMGGAEALQAEGAVAAAVERLSDPSVLRDARLTLDATVPSLPLARAVGAVVPLTGTLSGSVSARGTLAHAEVRLDFRGSGIEINGRPLGDLTAVIRHDAPTSTAEVSLRPTAGGALWAGATLEAPQGLADPKALRRAAATLRITSEGLELGFLPALLPGLVRAASGRLTVDLSADGPLAGLRPRGTVKLERGRLAVSELGDWSEIEIVASLGDTAIEVSRLDARRGAGHLSGRLSMRDLGTEVARFDGALAFQQVKLTRAGTDLATLDLPIDVEGSLSDELLDATVTLGAGTIRLPRKASGELQSLNERSDIVEAELAEERARRRAKAAAVAEAARPHFEARCHLLVPGKLFVKGERPAMNLELKGDSTWRYAKGAISAKGFVETMRGTVEPISGRVFHVERGRVNFPDAELNAALLDIVARFDNPVAVVTVTIGGTVAKPSIQFSSSPSMSDSEIAMLIATGRTEMNLNTSGVSTLTTEEASAAMVGAAMSSFFTGLVADKLPVDQFSLDPSRLRAGKYVTDKLFVGYAYRFDAKPEEGENANEVKAEYRITPRWNFEVRYGDAQAGDASLIWMRNY